MVEICSAGYDVSKIVVAIPASAVIARFVVRIYQRANLLTDGIKDFYHDVTGFRKLEANLRLWIKRVRVVLR